MKPFIEMKNDFFKNKFIFYNFIISLFLNISLVIYLYIKSSQMGSIIALHYNIYSGVNMLGVWYKIFNLLRIKNIN